MATAALGLLKGAGSVGGIASKLQVGATQVQGALGHAQGLANKGAQLKGSLNKLGSTVQGIVKGPGGLPSTAMPKVGNTGPCTCTHT